MVQQNLQYAAVWSGQMAKTSGGLTKADLTLNKQGKIVSKRRSAAGKKAANNLCGRGGGTMVPRAVQVRQGQGFLQDLGKALVPVGQVAGHELVNLGGNALIGMLGGAPKRRRAPAKKRARSGRGIALPGR